MKTRINYVLPLLSMVGAVASANSYVNCSVNSITVGDGAPSLMIVNLGCTAPDALASGGTCSSGTISSQAFVFDSSTSYGKSQLALLTAALVAGKNIDAFTYGACPAAIPNTLWLYSLKVYK